MQPRHDIHVHTHLSACCRAKDLHTPANILALAAEMGVGTIGFADHLWTNPEIEPSNWYRPQDASQISKLRAELEDVSTRVRVLVGCEAETVAPGRFGITRAFAESLDFVLLSCSHFHMSGFVAQPAGPSPRELADHILAFFRSGVSSGLPTSIAHPFVPCGRLEQFDAAIAAMSDGELRDVFGLAHDRRVAIEITTAFIPDAAKKPFSIETPIRILSSARQAGCMFTLGSDAHSPAEQRRLPELGALTEAAGITEADLHPMVRLGNGKRS